LTLRKEFSYNALLVLQLQRDNRRKEENNKPNITGRIRQKDRMKEKKEAVSLVS
jgi:hypothetical protein